MYRILCSTHEQTTHQFKANLKCQEPENVFFAGRKLLAKQAFLSTAGHCYRSESYNTKALRRQTLLKEGHNVQWSQVMD